ncbi:hypothetical protein ZTR_03123 [Talaromyces verruculosus]|nr:hypothetical protein ZTR_03123 [Talaromyces verruculosus]
MVAMTLAKIAALDEQINTIQLEIGNQQAILEKHERELQTIEEDEERARERTAAEGLAQMRDSVPPQ